MSASSQALAVAIRDTARKQAARTGRVVMNAQVVQDSPLRLELLDHDLMLDIDDDFVLSGSMAFLVAAGGIETGDVVLLFFDGASYVAFDLVPADDRAVPKSLTSRLINAKGDLLVGQGDDVIDRLPVGADGGVLVADHTAARGVRWGSPPVTVAEDQSSTVETGSSGADYTYQAIHVTLTKGTWWVQGWATLVSASSPDQKILALWNDTTGAEVPRSRSGGDSPYTGGVSQAMATAAVIVVPGDTVIKLRGIRNGSSIVQFGVASAINMQRLLAWRIG